MQHPTGKRVKSEGTDGRTQSLRESEGARLTLRVTAALATLFYAFAVIPRTAHLEALLLHAGCVVILGILWCSRPRVGFQFSLKHMMIGTGLAGLIVWGWMLMGIRAEALRLECNRMRAQRLGDDTRQAWDPPKPGDAKERARLLSIVRERTPGWGRALCALSCPPAGKEQGHRISQQRFLVCGTPFVTLLGYDELASAKSILRLEQDTTNHAETCRKKFLADLAVLPGKKETPRPHP